MRIIDRYLLAQYVKTFLICWISLTGLYVVVDAFSNLDEFMRYAEHSGKPLVRIMGEFYTFRAIYFFDRCSAILAMIAAMFTITGITRHNELTALLAAGISRMRVVRPILIAAAVVTVGAACSREFVIPSLREHLTRDPKDLIGNTAQEMRTTTTPTTFLLQGTTRMPHPLSRRCSGKSSMASTSSPTSREPDSTPLSSSPISSSAVASSVPSPSRSRVR